MSLESINKKHQWGETPLDFAYQNGRSPIKNDIVQLIRQHGGKANCYDRNGKKVGEGKGDLNDKEEGGSSNNNNNTSSNNNNNIQRAKRLNAKYKKEFPNGTPIVVACQKGRLEDLKVFV